jgi:Nucleotidyl transferase AbiEii toxin, Type IV TA system
VTPDPAEVAAVADRFGVAIAQVRRDHLISLLLGLLSRDLADQVLFFGGTALARTHLPEGRLSEDIDLMVRGGATRREVAGVVESLFASGLRRVVGRLEWVSPLASAPDVQAGVLAGPDGMSIRVQLLDAAGYPSWPTEPRDLEQRYADAPPARLEVPTRAAFVAGKTAAWHDRRACRDLWDLWALSRVGAIDVEAALLYRRLGPTGTTPGAWTFADPPTEGQWHAALAGQTRLTVTAAEAAATVAAAWTGAGAGQEPGRTRPVS